MRNSIVSLAFLILIVPSLCTVSVQLLSNTTYLAAGSELDILYQSGDLQLIYHQTEGVLASSFFTYNTQSGAQTSWPLNYPCEYLETGVFVSPSNQLYCFGYESEITRKGVALHLLNPSGGVLNRVSKSYSCSGCDANTIQTTTDGVAIIWNQNGYNVFYPQLGKFTCLFNLFTAYKSFVYTASEAVVLAAGLDYSNTTYFIGVVNCTNQDLVSYTEFNYSQYSSRNISNQFLNLYNQSTVGLSVVTLGHGVAVLTVVDLTNPIVFNSNFVFSNYAGYYWKINDTSFAMLTYQQSFVSIGVYIINNNFQVIQVAHYNLNFFSVSAIDNIPNTNIIIIYPSTVPCDTLEYVEFNIQTFTITNFYTENTPLFFSNGSVIYYSCQGYYVTNVNKISTNFVNLPSSSYLTYPSDYNVVYGFYTSNATNSILGCYITVFNASSSSITVNLLDSCPCPLCIDTMPGLFVYDISFNSAGQPCITYQTGLGGLNVIVGMNLYSTNIYGEGGDLVFPDYDGGVVRVWVDAGQDSSIETFNFMNNTRLNSTVVPLDIYSSFKLDQQTVFIETQPQTSQAKFYVYNILTGNSTFSVETKTALYTPTNGNPNAGVFGYNPSAGTVQGFAVGVKNGKGETVQVFAASGDSQNLEFKTDVNITATNNQAFLIQDFNATVFGTSYLYSIQSLSTVEVEL